jgi:hypothetical protein
VANVARKGCFVTVASSVAITVIAATIYLTLTSSG